jgi:hypothetical protein
VRFPLALPKRSRTFVRDFFVFIYNEDMNEQEMFSESQWDNNEGDHYSTESDYPMEGKPGEQPEDLEKRKQPGEIVEFDVNDPKYRFGNIELRGHDFQLGEVVSFGNGVGTLAGADSENRKFLIDAPKERGKGGANFIWSVDMDEVDYIVREETGAIKRNPDKSLFKPTLGGDEQEFI